MAFDNSLPHALPWNYPWLKDEIERRDEYIAQLEAELAHQRPQNHDSGAIDGEGVKVPAEDESGAHSEPDSREKLESDMAAWLNDNLCVDCYDADIAYGWLDRQASITERKSMEIREDLTADNLWMHERIAELQSQLEVAQGVNERQDLDYIEQKRRIEELAHQRTVMAKKLMGAERDRDRYRAALGKAIDCADEIRRLS